MDKKKYRVLVQYRVGDDWFEEGDEVELTKLEAQYPLSRGWLELAEAVAKTEAKKKVNTNAA